MISIVVPTRNRAHTIRIVGQSLYRQEQVSEIIFVDDGGSDDTADVVAALANRHPAVSTKVLRNDSRMGASACRIKGYLAASNDYILYIDDDTYLAPGYAATCLGKLISTGAGIVSGRRLTKRPDQSFGQAIRDFGNGTSDAAPFKPVVCEYREEARIVDDVELPLTHSTILTRKSLLERFSYDPHYSRGNGYREESDFQMNAFVNGHAILVTSACHCVELSRLESRTGGQRVSRLAQLYWSVIYTNYFYRKYFHAYAPRVGLRIGRRTALAFFTSYQVYMLFIRPARRLPHLLKGWRRPRTALRSVR